VGGAKSHILPLLARMTGAKSADFDIKLICLSKNEFAAEAAALGIETADIATGFAPRDIRRLRRVIRDSGADIVHCHGARANVFVLAARLFMRKRHRAFVTTIHGDYRADYLGNLRKRLTNGLLNAVALRFFDYYMPVNGELADTMISRRFSPGRIKTIFNGVDFTSAGCPAFGRSERAREDYFSSIGADIGGEDVVFGMVGRFHPVKDIPTLLRGFALARKIALERNSNKAIKLVIAGDGPEGARLKELAGELGLDSSVFFVGWLSEISGFFSAIDVNVISSLTEGLPYVALECAREGCALVSTRVGSMKETLTDGYDGFLYNVGDHDALGRIMLRLAGDRELIRSSGRRLYDGWSKRFSLDAQCALHRRYYGEIVAERERSSAKGRGDIIICGAYGRGNTGDEAILRCIISSMSGAASASRVRVISKNPAATRMGLRVDASHTFNFFSLIKRLGKTKLFISGGGTLIQDASSSRSLFYYLAAIWLAKKLGARVIMYGCGIGPVTRKFNRKLARRVINARVDVICVRDKLALDELGKLGVKSPEILLAADPVLGFVRQRGPAGPVLARLGIPEGSYILIALREWKGYTDKVTADAAAAARYAYERHGLTPVFLSMEYPRDLGISRKAAESYGCPCHVVEESLSTEEIVSLISGMRMVLAMRLHAIIFAAAAGVPAAGISYDVKVEGFMSYIGLPLFTRLEDCGEETLCGLIDQAMDTPAARLESAALELLDAEAASRRKAVELYNR